MKAKFPSFPAAPKWMDRFPRRVRVLWPQLPIALVLAIAGVVNLFSGIQYEVGAGAAESLSEMAKSMAILGKRTQMILGGILVLASVGLLWRLRTAWSFAVLLLGITIGEKNEAQKPCHPHRRRTDRQKHGP